MELELNGVTMKKLIDKSDEVVYTKKVAREKVTSEV